MFRAMIPPIARLCVTACGMYNTPMMLPAGSLEAEFLRFQATGWQALAALLPGKVTPYPLCWGR